MKKHESKLGGIGERMKWADGYIRVIEDNERVYVDSNNFIHNLYNPATRRYGDDFYYIHGTHLSKNEWLEEREKYLLEIHREEILNQI